VRDLTSRYEAAAAAIDAANSDDPTIVVVRGRQAPLALIHGQLAAEWIGRLVDEPDEALLLAGRAHHLRRWQLRRDSYPDGRAGYLRWRRDQKARHATEIAVILSPHGYPPDEIERVQRLIRREPIDGVQTVEDAACLVFVETQLAGLTERMDHALLVEVIRKTARKMSPEGLRFVPEIPLTEGARNVLAEARANSGADVPSAERTTPKWVE
jgi:hypothetical protein